MLKQKITRLLALVICFTIIVSLSGTSQAIAQQSGTVVADLGFRPDGNGFGFSNYGSDTPATNLTPPDMRRQFGDAVCGNIQGDTCTLVPEVQQLMDQWNQSMAGGHCYGMAVLSTLFFTGQEKAADFGGIDQTTGLPFPDNAKLQREIAYWFVSQYLKVTDDKAIKDKSPKDVLTVLTDALKAKTEYYVLGIFQPGFKNGHAISPYAVQDMGNGLFHVMVYDNNWPKDGNRFVEVDTNANTWTYLAATSPDVPEAVYKGDASTLTLRLMPISPSLQGQPCVFCKAMNPALQANGLAAAQPVVYRLNNAQTEPAYNEIMMYSTSETNAADLLITDGQGHRLGYEGGKFYSEIPGATFVPVTSDNNLFDDDPEPVYRVPVGVAFTVVLDGSAVKVDETTNVSMVGPGYDLAIENIKVKAGDKDTLAFSPDGSKIAYTPSGDEAPNITVGIQHDGPDYEFEIKGADVLPGSTINVSLDYDKGRLGIMTSGGDQKATTYAVSVERITDSADDYFDHDGLALDPNQTAYLEFGTWDGKGDLNISVDTNNDGTSDQTQATTNTHK